MSKSRTLASDQDEEGGQEAELELREKLRVLTAETDKLKADNAKYLTELRRQNESLAELKQTLEASVSVKGRLCYQQG